MVTVLLLVRENASSWKTGTASRKTVYDAIEKQYTMMKEWSRYMGDRKRSDHRFTTAKVN